MIDNYPTVRRFPRTLAEAFPRSCERACVIEVGPRPWWVRVAQLFRRFL